MNYTYILECKDGSLYTGWTNQLEKRIAQHKAGRGAKYTRARLPVKLVYYESFPTKEEAMSREWAIKQLSRREKLNLIAGNPVGTDSAGGIPTEADSWDPQASRPSEP